MSLARGAALAVALAVALAGCKSSARPPTASNVVAVVNGTPITSADLAVAMAAAAKARSPHDGGGSVSPPVRDEVLDRLIDDELAAQRARARGLDADPAYQDELATRQAQLDNFRRERLAMVMMRDVRERADVTDAQAHKFFDEHADQIRTVTRIWQILVHDRAAIEGARRELDAGARFEDVAARLFPQLPAGATPWDLGELKWNQIPAPWQPVLDHLAVGATSPIIEGPRGRLWIVKVVDRRVDPAIRFETARAAITTVLRNQAAEAAQAKLERELRAGATISRAPIPTAGR